MIGVALEGGGAKGAYEVGAYLALKKNKIKPSIITGTSIGSLNAAMIASGDINKLVKLWKNTTTNIFGINDNVSSAIINKKINKNVIKDGYKDIKNILKNKGIDTSKYHNIIKNNVNETKIRKSKIKLGLITLRVKGLEPIELTIDDIPEGKLHEYILASCYLPFFNFKKIIDDNYYLDGGFYNVLPLSLCEKYGCDTIYAIRIKGIGVVRNKLNKNTKIIEICPKINLGSIILFDHNSNERNMRLGYLDALKVLNKLDGNLYAFKKKSNNYYERIIKSVPNKIIKELMKKYKVNNHKDLLINITENILKKNKYDYLKVYNFKKTLRLLKRKNIIKDKNILKFISYCKLY